MKLLSLAAAVTIVCLGACTRASTEKQDPPAPTATPPTKQKPAKAKATVKPATATGLIVYLGPDGHWVTLDSTFYFVRKCNGTYDLDELKRLLGTLSDNRGDDSATIAAEQDTTYQQIVDAMDILVSAGWGDVNLKAPEDLDVELVTRERPTGKACGSVVVAASSSASDVKPKPGPTVHNQPTKPTLDELREKPQLVVVVSTSAVFLGNTQVATLKELEADYDLPALRMTLVQHRKTREVLILQADKSTASYFINAVLAAADDAGFEQILFAVNRK